MDYVGDYILESLLGTGAMGRVYRAIDTRTGDAVAVKTPHFSSDEDKQQILNEVQLSTQLRHPGIVRVHEVLDLSGDIFIVMELVDGVTLGEHLRDRTRLEVGDMLAISGQVAAALGCAHQHGILHRDIKPDNVMITPDGIAKVMDFGIAEQVDPDTLSSEQRIAGTALYMSPEQAMGQPLDERTDLYSLGAMMYEMATGHPPFEGDNLISLIYRHINEAPLAPRHEVPDLPVELNRMILRLLRKGPEERFGSADELASVLMAYHLSWEQGLALEGQGDPDEDEDVSQSVERLEAAFVGRELELVQLGNVFELVREGKARCILVEGEQGVGKSRLAEEFLRQQDGAHFLRGRCSELGISAPYIPFVEALQGYFGAEVPSELAQLLGSGGRTTEQSTQADEDPEAARQRRLDAVTDVFLEMTAKQPTIVVLEDVQFIDSGSLDLLQYLVRNAQDAPLMLVMNYTPGEASSQQQAVLTLLEQTVDVLESVGHLQRLVLQRLDQDTTNQLLNSVFEIADFGEDFLNYVYRETAGNPLFVLETLEWLRSERTIAQDALGLWSLVQPLEAVEIPIHVTDLLRRRLDGLTPEQLQLLQCASVAEGELFEPAMLAPVVAVQGLELLSMLGQLERQHRLIVPAGDAYRFDHVKLKQILYEGIPTEDRQVYHLQLARTLELRAMPSDVYALAYHYERTDERKKAKEYLIQAAESDEALYANDRAVDYYRRVLQSVDPREPEYLEALQRIAWLQSHLLGEIDEAIEAYHEIAAIAEQRADGLQQAEAIKQLGNLYAIRSEWEASEHHYEESRKLFEQLGNIREVGNTSINIGGNYFETGQLDEAMKHFAEAARIAETTGDTQLSADANRSFGMLYAVQDKSVEAIEYYRQSVEEYQQMGELRFLAQTQMHLGMTYARIGDIEQADRYFAASEQSARQTGNIRFLGFVCLNRAETLSSTQPDRAKELCDEALPLLRKADDRSGIIVLYRIYGRVYARLEQWDVAERCASTSIELAEEAQNQLDVADGYHDLGNIQFQAGKAEQARQSLEKACDLYRELGADDVIEEIQRKLAKEEQGASNA